MIADTGTPPKVRQRRGGTRRALPGLPLTLGVTLVWLLALVLLPLLSLVLRPWTLGLRGVVDSIAEPRVLAALELSFGAALLAALLDLPLGILVAWALVRYRFPGRRLLDAAVDLPFALPTAVAGLSLVALYAPNGWLGAPLMRLGVPVAYTRGGVLIALIFVGLPFVVRTLEPLLRDLPPEAEEAAATLGATRVQALRHVVLPALRPALLTGFSLAFARAVGEYGSVIFIAGNTPMLTEIAPLTIVMRLEQYDYAGAAAIGLAMLAGSFLVLLLVNLAGRRFGRARPRAAPRSLEPPSVPPVGTPPGRLPERLPQRLPETSLAMAPAALAALPARVPGR